LIPRPSSLTTTKARLILDKTFPSPPLGNPRARLMRRCFLSLCLICLLTGLGGAQTALPVKTLTQLKEATAFIRVEGNKEAASGTAFLIKTDGETGYLATNHHVVHLTTFVERQTLVPTRPTIPTPGKITPPTIGPRFETRTVRTEVVVPNPNITLVF